VFTTLIIPLFILFSYALFNNEIFNKFHFLITSTGYLAIVYLTIVLIIPLLNFQNNLFNTKNIGISAFYLSFLHLLLYMYDNNFESSFLFEDLVYRNYITSGYIAFILFLPMYLTSFSFFKNKFLNWRKIHKIIYLIYIITLVHIYFAIKADYYYLFIFIMLFSITVLFKLLYKKKYE
jgi:sulfoxide reductase heme-binding subunit YedZ